MTPEEVKQAYAAAAEVMLLASLDAPTEAPAAIEQGAPFVHENVYAVTFR